MFSNLPVSKQMLKYLSALVVLLVIAVVYFSITRSSNTSDTPLDESGNDVSKNAAFFIPPSSTTKQIEVTGEVIKVEPGERSGATHKIADPSDGHILIYATTNDDKLNQQEGNIVKLVGNVPLNENITENSLMKVDYISFK